MDRQPLIIPMRHALLSALTTLTLTGMSAYAADWPQFRGPDSNGISTETAWTHTWPAEGPQKLWQAEVGLGYSSVSIANGKLYTMGNTDNKDTVWCLDSLTGTVIWKHVFAAPLDPKYYPGGPSSTPTVYNGAVYTLSKSGLIYCLDATTGTPRWQVDAVTAGTTRPKWGYASSALIANDQVIFNVGNNGLSLKQSDGAIVWNSGKGVSGYASPVRYQQGDTAMLAMFGETALRGVELTTGTVRWTIPWKTSFGENSPDPIIISDQIAGNKLFLSTGHGLGSSLYTLPANGEPTEIWNNKELGNHLASSVLLDGHFYGFTGRVNKDDGQLGCLNATTGAQVWTTPIRGSLILADKRLIILTLTGELIVAEANPKVYTELARAQVLGGTAWTTPVLSHGRIYARNAKGLLICLNVGKP